MNFDKRLRALEARLILDPVILHLADGSTRVLHGGNDSLVRLLHGVCRKEDLSPGQAALLNQVRQTVRAQEPGGGRIVELLRCLSHAQADARDGIDLVGSQ